MRIFPLKKPRLFFLVSGLLCFPPDVGERNRADSGLSCDSSGEEQGGCYAWSREVISQVDKGLFDVKRS